MITAATAEIGRRSWAYRASLLAGAAQVGWIGAQWLIFGEYFILQPVMLGIGIGSAGTRLVGPPPPTR
jgi:hypothetical protein